MEEGPRGGGRGRTSPGFSRGDLLPASMLPHSGKLGTAPVHDVVRPEDRPLTGKLLGNRPFGRRQRSSERQGSPSKRSTKKKESRWIGNEPAMSPGIVRIAAHVLFIICVFCLIHSDFSPLSNLADITLVRHNDN